ncbi:unnamed protein product [Calicophoron daubneyi]|uniref:Uncharacterized protein n=1 Tax=Calicophoron daubneyi TaxID=300641 RepID=A0AAV2TV20_CALDB
MDCLEAQYGRWNTANMLKIQRDGQDFVILNIFFHDLFTPWFYTQGPIKNDEEWIHTDFKQLCQMVKARLIVKPCFQPLPLCWFKKKSNEMTESDEICPTYSPPHSDETNQLKPKQAHGLERTNSRVYRKWTPWTKVAYIPPSNQSEDRKIPRSSSARKKSWRRSEKYDPNQSVNVFILEDVIECNGLDKGIQTQQTYLRTNELLDV